MAASPAVIMTGEGRLSVKRISGLRLPIVLPPDISILELSAATFLAFRETTRSNITCVG